MKTRVGIKVCTAVVYPVHTLTSVTISVHMHNIMDKLAVLVDNQYWDLFSSEVPKKNLRSLNIEADVERTGLWSAPWEKLSMGTKTPPLPMPRFCRAPRGL